MDTSNSELNNQFLEAIEQDNTELFNAMLQKNPKFAKVEREDGTSAFILASKLGKSKFVKALIPYLNKDDFDKKDGHNPNGDTGFLLAVKGNHIDTVKEIMPHLDGEGKNAKTYFAPQRLHETALMTAARHGRVEMIHVLMPYLNSTERNEENRWGETALILAIRHADVETLKALTFYMDSKEVSTASKYGKTPITEAIDKLNLEMIEVLIKAGADLTIAARRGQLPLIMASGIELIEGPIITLRFLSMMHPRQLMAMHEEPGLMNRCFTHFGLQKSPMGVFLPRRLIELKNECIREVNSARNNIFHTMWALHKWHPAALSSVSKQVLPYLASDYPVWYTHRFEKDFTEISKNVMTLLKIDRESLKNSRTRVCTFLCGSRQQKQLKSLKSLPKKMPVSRRTNAPVYDTFEAPRAEQGAAKKRRAD